jgi:CheY-specific phosphatase CheX
VKNIATSSLVESKDLSFTIAFCFSEEVFLKYVSSMFGEDFKSISHEIRDLAAEWLNITLGHLKSKLNDLLGGDFINNIPMTIMGDTLVFAVDEGVPMIILPFESPLGQFHCLLILSDEFIIPWDNSFAVAAISMPED